MITKKLIQDVEDLGCEICCSIGKDFILAPTFSILKSSTFILAENGYCMRFEEEEDCTEMPWQAVLCVIPTTGFNHI